jgi:hypothetical protein
MKQVTNHWDSYGVFAIAQLILTKYDALDIAWEEAIKLYNEFYSSNYNVFINLWMKNKIKH